MRGRLGTSAVAALAVVAVVAAGGYAVGAGDDEAPAASVVARAADDAVARERIARADLTQRPARAPRTTPGPGRSYAPWPGYGRDARHSGTAPVRGPQDGQVRWTRRLEGALIPGPAIGADGTVYVASNAGVLHALDPATGKDRWTFDGGDPYGSDLSTVPLILPDATILWPGPDRVLYALGPDGRLRGRLRLDAFVLSPARSQDGRVYVTDVDGGLYALDLSRPDPRVRWKLALGRGVSYASATVAPDGTVLGSVDDELVAVRDREKRGTVRWRFRVGAITEVTPAVAPDGTIVLGTNDRFQYGIGLDGVERWRTPRNAWTYSPPAVSPAGVTYFGDHRGALNVLDAPSGRVLARHVGQARIKAGPDVGIWTAPAVDRDGSVYFGGRTGHVYGFSATGRKLLDVDTGETVASYPALGADGTLYVGSASGVLYAFGG